MRTSRRTAARLAATGAALTLTLGGLAACGDDGETAEPGTQQEDADPDAGTGAGTEPEGGGETEQNGQTETDPGVGVGGAEDSEG